MTKTQSEAIERACGHENLLAELITALETAIYLAVITDECWDDSRLSRCEEVLKRAQSITAK